MLHAINVYWRAHVHELGSMFTRELLDLDGQILIDSCKLRKKITFVSMHGHGARKVSVI